MKVKIISLFYLFCSLFSVRGIFEDLSLSISCSDSPCPTSCPDTFLYDWNVGSCTFYCMEEPQNGECSVGGSGCTSSCFNCVDSPCPTSCPEGYSPSNQFTRNDCTVYCQTKPSGDQCYPGGSGCVSSCVPSSSSSDSKNNEGNSQSLPKSTIVGIGVGGGIFLILSIIGVLFVIQRIRKNIPMNSRENELEKK